MEENNDGHATLWQRIPKWMKFLFVMVEGILVTSIVLFFLN